MNILTVFTGIPPVLAHEQQPPTTIATIPAEMRRLTVSLSLRGKGMANAYHRLSASVRSRRSDDMSGPDARGPRSITHYPSESATVCIVHSTRVSRSILYAHDHDLYPAPHMSNTEDPRRPDDAERCLHQPGGRPDRRRGEARRLPHTRCGNLSAARGDTGRWAGSA